MSEVQYKVRQADGFETHIVLVLSIVGGMLGIDRAYRGDIAFAILKTITFGGLFLWYLLDIWISAQDAMYSWRRYYEYLGEGIIQKEDNNPPLPGD